MVEGVDKVKENYLRRQAKRLDLSLVKSRAKKWSYDNQCGYMIIDPDYNAVVFGPKFDLDIEDVEELLNETEKRYREESE